MINLAVSPDVTHTWCCNDEEHERPSGCFFIDAPCDIPIEILEWYRAKANAEPWECPICWETFGPDVKRAEGWDCCVKCHEEREVNV